MRLSSLSLLLSTLTAVAFSAAGPQTTTLTFYLPAAFPGGALSLSPQTTLLLTTVGQQKAALLSKRGEFTVYNVTSGAYLAEVATREWVFSPQRVDVSVDASEAFVVESALTFRGNEWGNMGEKRRGARIEVMPMKPAEYYITREGFSPMKLLGSPMILIAIFSFAGMYFIPKLIENMDPELKAEFEQAQKQSFAKDAGLKNPVEGFDLAGFLSGMGSQKSGGSGGGASPIPTETSKSGKRK